MSIATDDRSGRSLSEGAFLSGSNLRPPSPDHLITEKLAILGFASLM